MFCAQCGQSMAPGARFCVQCGAAVAPSARVSSGGSAAPTRAPEATPSGTPLIGDVIRAMTRPEQVALGGFAAGVLSLVFEWASAGGFGVSAFSRDVEFRVGNWIGLSEPIDAAFVVLLVAGGVYMLLAPYFGWRTLRQPYAVAVSGALLLALGLLEALYLNEDAFQGVDVGPGVYLLVLAGVTVLAGGVLAGLNRNA